MSETARHTRPYAAPKTRMAPARSCLATLSRYQHVDEIKVAVAAGCRLLQLVTGYFPSPDMCLPVTVLEKELTIQTHGVWTKRRTADDRVVSWPSYFSHGFYRATLC